MKEQFYQKMQKFIDAGILTELYQEEDYCIFNYADSFYLVCPYIIPDNNQPFGMPVSSESVRNILENKSVLFKSIKNCCDDSKKFDSHFMRFPEKDFDVIKKFADNTRLKRELSVIDENLDKELLRMNIGKTK